MIYFVNLMTTPLVLRTKVKVEVNSRIELRIKFSTSSKELNRQELS